jgi:hypothetical protein
LIDLTTSTNESLISFKEFLISKIDSRKPSLLISFSDSSELEISSSVSFIKFDESAIKFFDFSNFDFASDKSIPFSSIFEILDSILSTMF